MNRDTCPEERDGKCGIELIIPGQCVNCCRYCEEPCDALCEEEGS